MTTIYIARVFINVLEAVSHKKFPSVIWKRQQAMIPDPLSLCLSFEGYPNIFAIILDNFPQNMKYFVKL